MNIEGKNHKHYWYLGGILLGQVLLALPGLWHTPLWLDEAYSALMARKGVGEILAAMRWDAGPPLYYILLHMWRAFFGESEMALRGLSLLFSILTTIGIYRIGQAVFSRQGALFAAGFWAVAPLAVYYSHAARNYTLFAFFSVGLTLCVVEWLFNHKKKYYWFALPFSVFMVYTHNVGWFYLLSLCLGLLLYQPWKKGVKDASTLLAVTTLFYLPWVPTLFHQMQNTHFTIAWIQDFWSPWLIVLSPISFMPGLLIPGYVGIPALPAVIQIITLLVWLGILVYLGRVIRNNPTNPLRFLLVVLLLGLLIPYVYSLVQSPVHLPGRTDFCLLPLWCLAIGNGLAFMQRGSWRMALAVFVAFTALPVTMMDSIQSPAKTEKEVVDYISLKSEGGDAVLCTGLSRPVLEYYLKPAGYRFYSYPLDMSNHLAHINASWYMKNIDLQQEARECIKKIDAHFTTRRDAWLILSPHEMNAPLLDALKQTNFHISKPIRTKRMGIQKLNRPLEIIQISDERKQNRP